MTTAYAPNQNHTSYSSDYLHRLTQEATSQILDEGASQEALAAAAAAHPPLLHRILAIALAAHEDYREDQLNFEPDFSAAEINPDGPEGVYSGSWDSDISDPEEQDRLASLLAGK